MTEPPRLRFDAAINPYGCSPAVSEALARAVRDGGYNFYGEPHAETLRARLAEHHGLTPESFAVYNGSGEAWVWLGVARLMMAGGTLIHPHPSYERFVAVAERCAQRVLAVPLDPGRWELPIDRFIHEARSGGATVAMISSPNNPTGNRLLDRARLETLLDALPGCLIVVDEAYAEYTGESFAPLVRRWPNLVVLKTFSKAYGLAGLRVGYLTADPRVADQARRMQIPWSVDSLALVAAEAALADQDHLATVVARIREDVADLGAGLRSLAGLLTHPTDANFFLVEARGRPWEPLCARLDGRGIVVRRRPDLPRTLRVTSMKPGDNRALLEALAAS